MARMIYDMLTVVFGPGLLEKTSDFISGIMDVLMTAFAEGGNVTVAMGIFMSLGVSLLILFFYVDLAEQASREMLNLDRLVVSFIKLVLALALVINCQSILSGSFAFTAGIYNAAKDNIYKGTKTSSSKSVTFWGNNTWPEWDDDVATEINGGTPEPDPKNKTLYDQYIAKLGDKNEVKDAGATIKKNKDGSISVTRSNGSVATNGVTSTTTTYKDNGVAYESNGSGGNTLKDHLENKEVIGTGLRGVLNGLPIMVSLLLPYIIGNIAVFASYFIAISNAIMLIVYGVYMPIAVAQCFDGGQRSTGIKYIKKFIATGLSFAIIVVCLWGGSFFQGAMTTLMTKGGGGTLDINDVTIKSLGANFKLIAVLCAIQFATIGAMFKGTQIANDVIGG